MSYQPTIPDLQASGDVIRDITEISDSLSVDDAVAYRVTLVKLLADVKMAIDMLDAQLVKTMELPRTHEGWHHIVRYKKDKERFDHSAIAKVVREQAILDGKGLLVTPREAAEQAVDLMSDLYISPSTTVKIGVLDALMIERRKDHLDSVRTWTPGDKFVEVTPILSEVQG